MSSLAIEIAKRFSKGRKRNGLLSFISLSSIVGIAVGVAVILVGLSAMNGFERELNQRVLSVIPHGEFEGVRGPITRWQSVVETSESDPRVIAAAPYVKLTALAEKGSVMKALQVKGIDTELEKKVSDLHHFLVGGSLDKLVPGQNQIILGKGIADLLGVGIGERITLMLPKSGDANKVQAPKRIRVTIVALLELSGQIDHQLALVPLVDAQQYGDLDQGVSGVSVRVNDVLMAEQIVKHVGNQLDEYVYLKNWRQEFGYLYRDIQMVRTIMYLVMVLVIGVACFNIVSTLVMAVKDRAGEVAILRTMGASDDLVRRIFIYQGLFSGLIGSLIGSGVGVLLALNLTHLIRLLETAIGHQFLSGDIYFVDFLPSELHWQDVFLVVATSVILSALATLYPASRAVKLDPATVLSSQS